MPEKKHSHKLNAGTGQYKRDRERALEKENTIYNHIRLEYAKSISSRARWHNELIRVARIALSH